MATFAEFLRIVNFEDQQHQYRVLKEQRWDIVGRSLSDDEISVLAKRICALPEEYRNVLFAHYYFKFSPKETAEMFGVEEPEGIFRYTCRLLSVIMGWNEGIGESSLRKAVELAVKQYTAVDERVMITPKYSRSFRKKLKDIKAAQAPSNIIMLVMQRVAVIILVFAIGFSTALVVNADFREAFFNWLIETFPTFSVFQMEDEEENPPNMISYEDIKIGYVTNGYELDHYDEVWSNVAYYYCSNQSDNFVIIISIDGRLSVDTQNTTINELILNGNRAFWWERNSQTYLVWTQNGCFCSLFGRIPIVEAIKIAENIEIKK